MLCCGYTLTDFPISIRLTSLALWQSNDCPSASKATLMNMDEYFMQIHHERLHNHTKAKHNKTVCIFLGIYCKPHKTQPSLESALDHEMSLLWQVARHDFFYTIGYNVPFLLDLQMTSNIQYTKIRGLGKSGKHSGHIVLSHVCHNET